MSESSDSCTSALLSFAKGYWGRCQSAARFGGRNGAYLEHVPFGVIEGHLGVARMVLRCMSQLMKGVQKSEGCRYVGRSGQVEARGFSNRRVHFLTFPRCISSLSAMTHSWKCTAHPSASWHPGARSWPYLDVHVGIPSPYHQQDQHTSCRSNSQNQTYSLRIKH